MEDRYEIRGKIGQGGIGSVHRAYDHKLKREVAIKRILTSNEDPSLQEEATKQLMVEAGALASLQHPHIVTILDVGIDEDGPYVVMELISGRTLDEIIEHSPVTWDDFKEIAMQSLEALIAAQELDMIHSDLKPPNIMLTWLPSGKFQVKIVDFGLAVLIQNQSQEEIEKMDAVFGSIFFMPPEQFERQTLDARSDLYSLGCCFYQALAGIYPFNGETGTEVMDAHLSHDVKPLQDVRGDIPLWACQWVMWLINRDRENRPDSARQALANFIQNEKKGSPAMSMGGVQQVQQAPRSRLVIPTTAPQTTPKPATTDSARALAAMRPTTKMTGLPPAPSVPVTTQATQATQAAIKPAKSGGSAFSKVQTKVAIAVAAVVAIGGGAVMIKNRNERVRRDYIYNSLIAAATKDGVREVRITGEELQILLDFIGNAAPGYNLAPAYQALVVAAATDRTNIDTTVAAFATAPETPPAVSEGLILEVLGKRGNATVAPTLIHFAANSNDKAATIATFKALENMAREDDAEAILDIIGRTNDDEVRDAGQTLMLDVIRNARDRNRLAAVIAKASDKAATPAAKRTIDSLAEFCKPSSSSGNNGTPAPQAPSAQQPRPPSPAQPKPVLVNTPSAEVQRLTDELARADAAKVPELITALSKHPEIAAHAALMNITGNSKYEHLLDDVIKALTELNSMPDMLDDGDQAKQRWLQIIWRTKTSEQKVMIIRALGQINTDWVVNLLQSMTGNKDATVSQLARETIEAINNRSR